MTSSSRSTEPSKTLPALIPRPSPEITPVVTVFLNSPSAVPMAIANCPTFNCDESPRSRGLRSVASILIIAISFDGSRLTCLTSYSKLSFVITLYFALVSETTCLFVTIRPYPETTKPVQISWGPPSSTLWLKPPNGFTSKTLLSGVSTETVTTEGDVRSTTSITTDSSWTTLLVSIGLLPKSSFNSSTCSATNLTPP